MRKLWRRSTGGNLPAGKYSIHPRYFVLNRMPYVAEPGAAIREPGAFCAGLLASPFFSVDIARRADGIDRIVEIGAGQVSDLVGWSVERFVEIWSDAR
jgi:hypothetical protein